MAARRLGRGGTSRRRTYGGQRMARGNTVLASALHPPPGSRSHSGTACVRGACVRGVQRGSSYRAVVSRGARGARSLASGRGYRRSTRPDLRARHARRLLRVARNRRLRGTRASTRAERALDLVASRWASVRGECARASDRHPPRPSDARRCTARGRPSACRAHRARALPGADGVHAAGASRRAGGARGRGLPSRSRISDSSRPTATGLAISAAEGRDYATVATQTEGPIVPASCGAQAEPQVVFSARLL
jgi:hypothetical protein